MIIYRYNNTDYNTESEAQAAVVVCKSRLENNPNDWCRVKEIEQNQNGTWLILSAKLTDSEINSLDETKHYLIYSIYSSENEMPLTSSQLQEKILEYRQIYAAHLQLNFIHKLDGVYDDNFGFIGSVERITPNIDMSGYV